MRFLNLNGRSHSTKLLSALFGILTFLFLSNLGCVYKWNTRSEITGVPPLGEPINSDDPIVQRGQEVFNTKGCVYCHGPNGVGGVKNNNAKDGIIPALTRVVEGYSDEELRKRILKGVREIAKENLHGPTPPLYMPAWKWVLTDSEMEALISFIKSLLPKETQEW